MKKSKRQGKDVVIAPLESKDGEKVWYANLDHLVGSPIENRIYAHMDYIENIVPIEIRTEAEKLFKEQVGIKCNAFSWWKKKPHLVRFCEAPDFNTERDPSYGRIWHIDTKTGEVTEGATNKIFHHKWLLVKQDYEGFDVKESYRWSKLWLGRLQEPASVKPEEWLEQLDAAGLK